MQGRATDDVEKAHLQLVRRPGRLPYVLLVVGCKEWRLWKGIFRALPRGHWIWASLRGEFQDVETDSDSS